MAVILLDTLANSLCIAMMLRITGSRRSTVRIGFAALTGALGALGVRQLGFSGGIQALCWFLVALGMACVALGTVSLRAALVLLACEGFLGGTIYALYGALGTKEAAWGVGAVFALMLSVSAIYARSLAADVHTVRIRITGKTGTAEFEALVDSGNCLRDYLTHRAVIVLPEADKEALGLIGMPLRPIFADTAGGRQMMDCFTPCGVWLVQHGRMTAVSACVAFSSGLKKHAPALLPQSLLTGRQDESRADREGNAYGKTEG